MFGKPLISIAMTTFNGEKYLREQLDSIYNQTYPNIEVVVCDDCSSDGTVEILKEYQAHHGLKYLVNEKNLGYTKNFEKAISLCRGEYIALSDQDDRWLPEKLEVLLRHIGDHSVIHSDARLINEQGEVFSDSFARYAKKMTDPHNEMEMCLNGCVTGCTCMFKRDFRDEILPFPEDLYVHDKWIGIVAFRKGKLFYLDKPLIDYRIHSSNNIGAGQPESAFLSKILGFFEKKDRFKINEKYKTGILKQIRFINAYLNNYGSLSEHALELKEILSFYQNIYGNKHFFNIIKTYFKFLSVFEKNKPIKHKIIYLMRMLSQFLNKKKGFTKEEQNQNE